MNCLHFKNLNLKKIYSELREIKNKERKCENCEKKTVKESLICLNVK